MRYSESQLPDFVHAVDRQWPGSSSGFPKKDGQDLILEPLRSGGVVAQLRRSPGSSPLIVGWRAERLDDTLLPFDPLYDSVLRGSGLLRDDAKLRAALGPALELIDSKLIAYHPERRAVLRLDCISSKGPRVAYLKLLKPKSFKRARRLFKSLPKSSGCARFIRPAMVMREWDSFLTFEAKGERLHESLLRSSSVDVSSLAKAIVELSHTPTLSSWRECGWELERQSTLSMLLRGKSLAPDIVELLPLVEGVSLQRFDSIPGNRVGFLHRDLHDKQMFNAQGAWSFIDLEGVCRGPVGIDIVNLAEHWHLRSLQNQYVADRSTEFLHECGLSHESPHVRKWRGLIRARLVGVYARRPSWADLRKSLQESAMRLLGSEA